MPIFYEVISKEGKINHLFGTIHCNEKRLTNISRDVKLALQSAREVCIEADINPEIAQQSFINSKTEWDNTYLYDHQQWATKANVQTVVDQVSKHFPWYIPAFIIRGIVSTTPPVALYFIISSMYQTKKNPATVLDGILYRYAKKHNKLAFLEKNDEQTRVMFGLFGHNLHDGKYDHPHLNKSTQKRYDYQRQVFDSLINKINKPEKEARELAERYKLAVEHYLDGDIGALHELAQKDMGNMYNWMITERDLSMTYNMQSTLTTGNAFIAVGMMHLKGIVSELKSRGYTVNPVTISERIYPILDFYDRNADDLINTGLLYFGSAAFSATGLWLVMPPYISICMIVAGALLALAALYKSLELAGDYLCEPVLESDTPTMKI